MFTSLGHRLQTCQNNTVFKAIGICERIGQLKWDDSEPFCRNEVPNLPIIFQLVAVILPPHSFLLSPFTVCATGAMPTIEGIEQPILKTATVVGVDVEGCTGVGPSGYLKIFGIPRTVIPSHSPNNREFTQKSE